MHRVRISIRYDNEAIALSISDTGPGIAPDIVERIFDPFFSTKRGDRDTGGTGLGLSISRSILHDIGGDLIVESVHGAGATFIAVIPTEGRRVIRHSRFQAAIGSTPPNEALLGIGRRGRGGAPPKSRHSPPTTLSRAPGRRRAGRPSTCSNRGLPPTPSCATSICRSSTASSSTNGCSTIARIWPATSSSSRPTLPTRVASSFFARVEKPVLEKPVTRERLPVGHRSHRHELASTAPLESPSLAQPCYALVARDDRAQTGKRPSRNRGCRVRPHRERREPKRLAASRRAAARWTTSE